MNSFYFDIVIIIVTFLAIFLGIHRGFFEQLKSLIALAGSFAVLYFTLGIVMNFINGIAQVTNIINKVFNWISVKIIDINLYRNTIITFIVATIMFIIVYIIIKLFLKLFRANRLYRLLHEIKKISKILGGIIALGNAYLLVFIWMTIIGCFTPINCNTFLTSMLFKTNNEYVTLSEYNEMKNVDILEAEALDEKISFIDGSGCLYRANLIYNFSQELLAKDLYFANNIYPLLDEESKDLIDSLKDATKTYQYLSTLLKTVDEEQIYKIIIKNMRKSNSKNVINDFCNYVLNNDGIIYYLNDPEHSFSSIDDVIVKLTTDKMIVLDGYSNNYYRDLMKDNIYYFQFYNNFKNQLYTLVSSSSEGLTNINEYNLKYQGLFVVSNEKDDIDRLTAYINSFNVLFGDITSLVDGVNKEINALAEADIATKDNLINKKEMLEMLHQLNLTFSDYKTIIEEINKIKGTYSFSSRYVLSKNYKVYFETKEWEKLKILNALINDTICLDNSSSKMYKEYILNEYNLDTLLSEKKITNKTYTILTN